MANVYTGYLWRFNGHDWRLEKTARDIVAHSMDHAKRRTIDALMCRQDSDQKGLMRLRDYLNGNGPQPHELRLRVTQVAEGPR